MRLFPIIQSIQIMEYIDIRSDTVTMPTPKMRQAMKNHIYGYPNEDTVLESLLTKATQIFKMEAAILLPSGVMANQIAVMSWTKPGDEIILEEKCHIFEMENGSIADLSGVTARAVKSQNGELTPQLIEPNIKSHNEDDESPTKLICLQNSIGNGRVYSLQNLRKIKILSQKYKLKIHTDGARIFYASAALDVGVSELAKYTDSVCFCLSKGLCAPYGSILLGKKEFIRTAKKNMLALLGKQFNSAALFPAAGLIALEQMSVRVREDNKRAKILAQRLSEIRGIVIDLSTVQANIIFFTLSPNIKNQDKITDYFKTQNIKLGGYNSNKVFRIITHYYINQKQVEEIIKHFKIFIETNQ